MSGSGPSGPSGRSPFPATRNPRTRASATTAGGSAGLGIGVRAASLGGDSASSRGSNAGISQYTNPLLLSSGAMSTMTTTGSSTAGDTPMETSTSTRNQQHHQQQQQQQHLQSPLFHSMLRFSPNNAGNTATTGVVSSWSPLHRGNTVTNAGRLRNRFFDNAPVNRSNSKSRVNEELNNNDVVLQSDKNNKGLSNEDSEGMVIDGIPVDQLRLLSQQTLLQSPETSVFYSNILFAKTGEASDALLLAKSHYAAEQYTACLRILDEATLLQQDHPWEAVLVACLALQARSNWVALAEMLEDVCRLPDPSLPMSVHNTGLGTGYNAGAPTFRSLAVAFHPLEDDDTLGWIQLKQFIDSPSKKKGINKQEQQQQGFSFWQNNIHSLAQICYFRGKAYYEMGCMMRAVTYWKRSLQIDCQCQMAWEALLKRNLLSPGEAYDWITHEITFKPHQEWLRSLYLARIELTPQEVSNDNADQKHKNLTVGAAGGTSNSLTMHGRSILDASSIHMTSPSPAFLSPAGFSKDVMDELACDHSDHNNTKESTNNNGSSPIQEDVDAAFDNLWNKHKLQDAPQVLAMSARRAYRRYEWKAALKYCEDLAQFDPSLSDAAFCYVATLVVLGYKRTLFRLAHEWVEASPKSAHAWFAVGAYYYCIQRYHVAQRHFCRATRLDPQCTEAWIAFGCSFASCDESDQALASYRAAQRLSPGEHTSLLYMGMEYVRTNHLVLASYFLQASLNSSVGDPLCLHELGVLAAQKGEHTEAIDWFRRALIAAASVGANNKLHSSSSLNEIIEFFQDTYWEPTLFNLGHSYRKTRQFDKASVCFHRCIGLCPEKYSTYAALAFTKQLMGNLDAAISYFHQALSIKADDPFSTEMLNRALRAQTMSLKQRIFDIAPVPPLAESTNKGTKETPRGYLHSSVMSSSMILSPDLSMWSKSNLKDDKSSIMSEEMECDPDLSATS